MPIDPTIAYAGIFLFIVYLALLFTAGLMTFRKGRKWLGIAGFFLPPLWLAGALMKPKRKESRTVAVAAHSKKKDPQPTGATSHPKKQVPQTAGSSAHNKKRKRKHK